MQRLFSPSGNIFQGKITLSGRDDVHHLKDVLRLKTGEKVVVFDEQGNEYSCFVEGLSDKIILGVKGRHAHPKKEQGDKISIAVACAIPKKSIMDEIVDKLTQLGAARIIPLLTKRVVVTLDKHKESARLERWKRIALNASCQSQRRNLPVIEPIQNIEEALLRSQDYDLKLIPTLAGQARSLKEACANFKAGKLIVFIGPEGDFTAEEVDSARRAGCIPVSLGDLVLRVETAAVAVASFFRFYFY